MTTLLVAEDLHGGLALRQGGDEVRHRGLPVRVVAAGADRGTLAQARVDHDTVDDAEVVAEGSEHLEHLVVVGDVEGPQLDAPTRVLGDDLVAQLL